MKKYILVFLFISLITSSIAQTPGMMQRKMLPGKIDTLLLNYLAYSKLSSLEDVGFSDAVANQYKFLFVANAKITDEVNPAIYDKDYDHPFDLPVRTVDDYIARTKGNYPSGLFVKYDAIQVDYTNQIILLLKETNGTTANGLLYKITDTLKLKLNVSPDFKTIKIQDAVVIGYKIDLLNDDDRDFIPNALDKCPKEQGFRSGTGCFTKEEKAQYALAEKEKKHPEKEKEQPKKEVKPKPVYTGPVLPGLFLGLTFSGGTNNFTAPTPFNEDNLGYTNMLKGSKSVYSVTGINKNKQAPFTQLQLDVEYYIGRKKNIGIATGIGFSSFNASFSMDTFHVEYQSTDAAGNIYRRSVHVHNMDEKLKISSINIPILLQYKFSIGEKGSLSIGAGVNYHIVSSAKTSGTATADYEAIYKWQNGYTVYDNSIPQSNNSWMITRSNVEAHNGKSGEAAYFAQKKADGYDVGIDQSLTHDATLKLGNAMGPLVRLGVDFKLSGKLWLSVLLQYQGMTFTNNSYSTNYILTNETGSYNALLNNVEKLKVSTISLGAGIKYTLK
jgi:outer membrane protein W